MSLNGVVADLDHNDRQVRLHGDTSPWRLVVDFHVRFNFTNVRNEAGGRIDRWDQEPRWLSEEARQASTLPAANPRESALWRARFIRVVGQSWSHRWLLEPNTREASCSTFSGCGPTPQDVDVILNVRDVDAGAADAAPSGVRVHTVRVHKARYASGRDSVSRRIDLGYYDNHATPSPDGTMQVASVHEVGHSLGVEHPGEEEGRPECDSGDNPDGDVPFSCYQDGGGDSRMVMGAGMYIRPPDYRVFAHMINALLRQHERGFRYRQTNRRPGTHVTAPGVNQCAADPARYGDGSWPESPGPLTACGDDLP